MPALCEAFLKYKFNNLTLPELNYDYAQETDILLLNLNAQDLIFQILREHSEKKSTLYFGSFWYSFNAKNTTAKRRLF